MKIRSIETTPNPNSMKLNLDEPVSERPVTARVEADVAGLSETLGALLTIDGVESIFAVRDFVTLTRRSRADWQPILAEAAQRLGLADGVTLDPPAASEPPAEDAAALGQVEVAVQVFRGVPIQVRVRDAAGTQARVSMPERFAAALRALLDETGADYLAERLWQPLEPRHGGVDEVAQMIADELASRLDDAALAQRVDAAKRDEGIALETLSSTDSGDLEALASPDWRVRLRAIQSLVVNDQNLDRVLATLGDERGAVRRWAAAALGMSDARPRIIEALSRTVTQDSSVSVRRTAGDALSDLADASATPAMCEALSDTSKLVRWRAARFLNEVGDDSAIEALNTAAASEPELEVKMEMMAALERIEGGAAARQPMWMQIAKGSKD